MTRHAKPRMREPRRRGPRLGVLASAALLSAACAAAHETTATTLRIGSHAFAVETAATPAQRQRGLMERETLGANAGMLFVFEVADRHCFWMRNTPLPLSIAFIDDAGRIVGLADMAPHSDTRHCPAKPVRYALEVARGGFARRAIVPGMRVEGLPQSGRHR